MNLAILHYHLNRGGVTRVIENQLRALDAALDPRQPWRALLLEGGRCDGWNAELPNQLKAIRLTLRGIPALDYDSLRPEQSRRGALLTDEVAAALSESNFSAGDTVVHVHNHAVGKNAALPAAVRALAEQGYPLVLQIHDFAEDFRPANFRWLAECLAAEAPIAAWHGWLYPQAPHVHYAVLNGRDYHILESAGIDTRRLCLLPNPVTSPGEQPPRHLARQRLAQQFAVDTAQPYLLYPVRGIRRKNVGEALLYSRLAEPGTVVGITLPPASPVALPIYDQWRETAQRLDLPCRFDVAAPGALTFTENLAAADTIMTTSVAEGFGMVFLEAWLTGHVLAGRDLPEITADFVRAGLRLDLMRSKLLVPVAWIGADRLHRRLAEAYGRTLAAYGRSEPRHLAEQVRAKTADGLVDFGDLDEPLQTDVLETVCADQASRGRVLALNPWIEPSLSMDDPGTADLVRSNQRTVEDHFTLVPIGRQLEAMYRRVIDSRDGSHVRPESLARPDRILDWFLDFKRFRMVRS